MNSKSRVQMNKTARLTTTFSIVMALTVPAFSAFAQTGAPQSPEATLIKASIAGVSSSSRALVQKLYADRAFSPIFVVNGQLSQSAMDLRNAVMTLAPTHGLHSADYWTSAVEAQFTQGVNASTAGALEMELAKIYVDLATHISIGRLNPQSISKDIKYERRALDASALASGVQSEGITNMLSRIAPQHSLYKTQQQILQRLQAAQANGGFPALAPVKATLKLGVANPVVSQIKERLRILGYSITNTSTTFDQELLTAIQDLQANNQGETTKEI